jgi:hypothetical protein
MLEIKITEVEELSRVYNSVYVARACDAFSEKEQCWRFHNSRALYA